MRAIIARLPVALAAIVLCGMLAVGCGAPTPAGQSGGGGSQATIGMNADNFTTHSITITAGKPVTFDDTVDGGALHVICVGTGTGGSSSCDDAGKAPNAPAQLVGQGLTVNPGQKMDITFQTAGTYRVICTIHPGMYIDITVK